MKGGGGASGGGGGGGYSSSMMWTSNSTSSSQPILPGFMFVCALFGGFCIMYFGSKSDGKDRIEIGNLVREIEYDNEKSLQAHTNYVEQGSVRKMSLPSSELEQAFVGTYKERGATGHTYYTLQMLKPDDSTSSLGSFKGYGWDQDGQFLIRNAVFSSKTGKFAWAEHSLRSNLVATCEVECVDEACIEMKGFYRASTGLDGSLRLTRKLSLMKETSEQEEESEKVRGWFDFLSFTTDAQDEEKDEWVRALDQESGRYYYWNRKTRQTTWYEPPEFVNKK